MQVSIPSNSSPYVFTQPFSDLSSDVTMTSATRTTSIESIIVSNCCPESIVQTCSNDQMITNKQILNADANTSHVNLNHKLISVQKTNKLQRIVGVATLAAVAHSTQEGTKVAAHSPSACTFTPVKVNKVVCSHTSSIGCTLYSLFQKANENELLDDHRSLSCDDHLRKKIKLTTAESSVYHQN